MSPQQMPLFDRPTLNITRQLKEHMNAVVKNSNLSRDQIVDKMNVLAERYGVNLASGNGKGLTLETFEKWINPNEMNRQMPLKALPIFCAALQDVSTINILTHPLGAEVIGPKERRKLEWADAKLDVQRKSRKIRELEKAIS